MEYWIFLGCLFLLLIILIISAYKNLCEINTENNVRFFVPFITMCCVLAITALFAADIPSAIRGGEEVYVNELPDFVSLHLVPIVVTDNEVLKSLRFYPVNNYEKYGNYRIRYTKLTRCVLAIEDLDK